MIGRDGQLEQFLHAGMDGDLVAEIGELPGTGDPGPADPSARPDPAGRPPRSPASPGFPPGTRRWGLPRGPGPGRGGGLRQPVPHRADAGGEFTAEDEQLAVALAAAAGGAIANARRYAESEQRRRWLDASAELTPLLLAEGGEQPYDQITRPAAAAAEADFAVLAVPRDRDPVVVVSATGPLRAGLGDRGAADRLAGRAGDPRRQANPGRRLPPRNAAPALGAG